MNLVRVALGAVRQELKDRKAKAVQDARTLKNLEGMSLTE